MSVETPSQALPRSLAAAEVDPFAARPRAATAPSPAREARAWVGDIGDVARAVEVVIGVGPDAVLVIDAHGRVIHGNARAKAYLDAGGLVRRGDAGRVAFVDGTTHEALQRALGGAGAAAGAAVLPHLNPGRHATVQIYLCRTMLAGEALFVLRIRDLAEACAAKVQAAAACFGLTPAEARVLHATLNGLTPAAHAADTGLKISTVRTHLAALFAKTQTNGQAQLIVKVMNLPEF